MLVICPKISFHPFTNSLLAAMMLFLFFYVSVSFFVLNFLLFSSKLQNTETKFLWEIVELQTQFCRLKFFGAISPGIFPKWANLKLIFGRLKLKALIVFALS